MRIASIFLALALLFALTFALFGGRFDAWLLGQGAVDWLRSLGAWAWGGAVLLLASDLLLPIPATAVMGGLGVLYGPLWGGLAGAAGSMLSGLLGYLICRAAGRRAAERLAGARDVARAERFFARSGGWAVVLSRWLPILPEVVACMAGLARMPFRAFSAALLCGSLPMAFTFAALGHAGAEAPLAALAASAVLPVLLWAAIRKIGLIDLSGASTENRPPGRRTEPDGEKIPSKEEEP